MPRAYACIKQYQSTPPSPLFVECDRFVAVKQLNANKFTKMRKYLVQRVLTRGAT